MFCSHIGNNSQPLFSNFTNQCVIEFMNLVCFSLYIYVFFLLLICLRRSPDEVGLFSQKRFLVAHNIRNSLLLVLIVLYLIEFMENLLTTAKIWYIKFIPLMAVVAIVTSQVFYNRLEECGKHNFLGVSLMFWVCCGICRILAFVSNYYLDLDAQYVRFTTSLVVVFLLQALIVCDYIALFTQMKNEKPRITASNSSNAKERYLYRHLFCNWYSKITFYWLTPILYMGYINSLRMTNAACIPKSELSSLQIDNLEKAYFKDYNCSLWTSIKNLYWKTFLVGGFLKLLGDVAGLILSLGISVVVTYIETHLNRSPAEEAGEVHFIKWKAFLSNGYVMALIVFWASLAQATLSQNSTHLINIEGIRLRNALQGLVYQKLLRIRRSISTDSGNSDAVNIGNITNMVTEDSCNIMSCFWIGNYVWAIPLKIFLLIFLLYEEMGISAVIGSIACIILMLLLQFFVGMKMSKNYKSISEWSDKRLRRINEILQGIRFIKLCGWETDFIEEVSRLRNKELSHLNMDSLYWTAITFLANTSSIIVAIVTLTLHYFLKSGKITLSTLFTSLALFNQLTVPLFIFPIMVPIIMSAMVSARRIQVFLSLPEIEKITTPTGSEKSSMMCSQRKISLSEKRSVSLKKCEQVEDQGIRLHKIVENCESQSETKTKNLNRLKGNKILTIHDAVFSWCNFSNTSLKIDSISIYTGTLNLIVGEKASGKTSLVLAVLGEMTRVSGKMQWNKSLRIGYVPETPFLLNDTVKVNITFGYPYQEKHFARVIQLCVLRSDINKMPNKELTVIGDRGHGLSGGQKQRIMVARMLYSRPDVILMDNPFCSLDSKTTNYIFENTVKKFLAKENRTVIMVTNCKKFLPEADQIIVMENMKLKAVSSYANINKVALEEIQNLQESIDDQSKPRASVPDDLDSSSHRSLQTTVFVPLKKCRSVLSGSRYFTHDLLLPTDDCDVGAATLLQKHKRSRAATVTEYPKSSVSVHQMVFRVSSLQTNPSQYCLKKKRRFDFEDEFLAKRHPSTISDHIDDYLDDLSEPFADMYNDMSSVWDVSKTAGSLNNDFNTYVTYMKNCGLLTILVYFILTFGWQMIRILTEFWLSSIVSKINEFSDQEEWYLYWYVSLSVTSLLLSLCSTSMGQYAGSVSRKFFHEKILNNVMKCSIQFFDNVSFGQIISQFSTDTEIIDKKIPTLTQRLVQFQLLCLSAILLNCLITPWFVVLAIPIALIYYKIQMFYRRSSKEIQHLENLMKMPIISHFSETFNGLEVIRALDQTNTFLNILFQKIDAHTNIFLISNSSNRWLGIMLDYLGGVIVFAAMILSLLTISLESTQKTSVYFGLAINYTLLVPIYLTWVVKFLIDLDIYMEAVNRIQSFSELSNEDYNESANIPLNWPHQGAIQYSNVTLKYNEEGPAIIQNLSIQIEPRQKVGICGQTGSGKSSLMMSLFRMIPHVEGRIIIDDVDIDSIPLQYLRTKISIVPQNIILFSGTLRQNLDLRNEFSDEKLWLSLKMVQMDKIVAEIGGLDATVHDGGSNLSVGEKQSICLARAILHDTCCLILDEATSMLQPGMEVEFLRMVLKIFDASTVIVVTHRVTSMLDFDRILVMDNGALIEDGSPGELLAMPNSKFSSFMRTA